MDVPFLQLQFTLEQSRQPATPYALFALKQLFPRAFRKVNGCAQGIDRCAGGADCPCRSIFSQALTTDPAALRRYQKPPLPFAFNIPVLSCPGGTDYLLSLVIVGDGTRHLELYLKSLQQLFAAGHFPGLFLKEIAAVAQDGTKQLLGSGSGRLELASIPFRSFAETCSAPINNADTVSQQLLAPLRLLHNGRPLRSPQFPAVAGALFRRISALAYYYGGVELEYDFKWLAARSHNISSVSFLEWTNWGGSLQGCTGELTFTGELDEFMPFLRLGELLNVGKGASYGMGSYSLAP